MSDLSLTSLKQLAQVSCTKMPEDPAKQTKKRSDLLEAAQPIRKTTTSFTSAF